MGQHRPPGPRTQIRLVDSTGLLLAPLVSAAIGSDLAGAMQRLKGGKRRFPNRMRVWADAAYAGLMDWARQFWNWIFELKNRPPRASGFVVIPRRWVVQRKFGWLTRYRWLWRDRKVLPSVCETMITVAMIHLMARRVFPATRR